VTCSCGVNRAQIDALATPCVVGNCTALDVARKFFLSLPLSFEGLGWGNTLSGC